MNTKTRVFLRVFVALVVFFAGLPENQPADDDGSNETHQIGKQTRKDRVSWLLNPNRAEVDRQYIEGGLGTPVDGRREASNEGIRTVRLHQFGHNPKRTAP